MMGTEEDVAVQIEHLDFDLELECGVIGTHNCTVTARWSATATCNLKFALRCKNRYLRFLAESSSGFECAGCHKPQTVCWKVVPI